MGLYPVLPFYLSTLVCMVIVESVPQFLNNIAIFFMANLGGSVWLFFVIMALENLVGISLGVMLSACFTNVTMAAQIAPAVVILFLIFSGYLINESSIPVYFIWLREISFIRYAFKATAVNEFEGAQFDCNMCAVEEVVRSGNVGDCDLYCVTEGEQILRQLKFDQDNMIVSCCMILLGIAVVVNVLAVLILWVRVSKFLQLTAEVGPDMDRECTDSNAQPAAGDPEKTTPREVPQTHQIDVDALHGA